MRPAWSTVALWASIGVLAYSVITSCESGPTDTRIAPNVERHFRGTPAKFVVTANLARVDYPSPEAAWDGAGHLYVVTWSSSSCPDIPATVSVADPRHLAITLVVHDFFPQDTECTGDLAPTTSVIQVPPGLDESHNIELLIDTTKIELPAIP